LPAGALPGFGSPHPLSPQEPIPATPPKEPRQAVPVVTPRQLVPPITGR
jgi:hypothetical protein